jgi:hypothetical protein
MIIPSMTYSVEVTSASSEMIVSQDGAKQNIGTESTEVLWSARIPCTGDKKKGCELTSLLGSSTRPGCD